MFTRSLTSTVRAALHRSPVVLVNGARQVGKSTLARMLVDDGTLANYYTLDQLTTLGAAHSDPEGFVGGFQNSVVIDEVQMEPLLFRAIKAEVDRDRRPGRFLLTGSADLSVLPDAAQALVGRAEVLTLWPLSQGEIRGTPERFLGSLFEKRTSWRNSTGFDRNALAEAICTGGFPEPLTRDQHAREPWYRSYIDLVLRRDVADRVDVTGLVGISRLLGLLAARTMTLVNIAEVARALEMPASTVRKYVSLLEAAMLVRMIPAYSPDMARRMVKSPKVAIVDTGLAASLLGNDVRRLTEDPSQFGRLAEAFVINEIQRQASWSDQPVRLMHARTAAGREVDIVIEAPDGRVAGIEVKAGATLGPKDFAGLKALRTALGKRFAQGVLLYTGDAAVPYGPDLWAVPISALWEA